MAIRRIKFKEDPVKMAHTAEEKLERYGTTREDGERYFDHIYGINREKYRAAYEGTATIPSEPVDMVYTDLTCLPPEIEVVGKGKYPLPLAIITEVINRSKHRVITRNCSCRTTFECRSYDRNIGCIHIGEPTAEEPESVAFHVSKEEAIEHTKFALSVGLLPYVGKFDYDNEFWGIWSGDPMFTVCFCCPCCCLSRKSYTFLHPLNKPLKFNGAHGLFWKLNKDKCIGADCAACTRHCPARCIELDGEVIKHDATKCIKCGECMSRCPRKAISICTNDLEATLNGLMKRYDGLCGDLYFDGEEGNKDYAAQILANTPFIPDAQ